MENIALIDVDSKIPNIALMKLSAWHKARGDKVGWWCGQLFNGYYDKAYASKIFDFSQMPEGMPENVEIGGSGYDLKKSLPPAIERLCPDYDLYPDCDYSLGFLTRGCSRKCPYCIVPQKEGSIKIHQKWETFRNPNGKYWVFLDNNILAFKGAADILAGIIEDKLEIDFNQGMDIRLVTPSIAGLLSRIKWKRFLRFAFDRICLEESIPGKVEILERSGIKSHRLLFYVLIGYDTSPEEDLYRVEMLREMKIDPFVMPYDKSDPYQKNFSRWVNRKAIFKSVKWEDYSNKQKTRKR
jgi:hypothetical protein